MRIGTLARLSGATPKAIRLYESLGLLEGVVRQGAYRSYTPGHLRQVQLIRQAQTLGFRLAELGEVLRPGNGEPDWPGLLHHLLLKRDSVQQEIDRLQQRIVALEQVAADLRSCLAPPPTVHAPLCRPLPGTDA